MSLSRVSHRSTRGNPVTARRIVWWVCGWAALAVIVQLLSLFVVFPMVDRDIVFSLAGRRGVGTVVFVLAAYSAAVLSTIAAVLGVGGAGIARALYRARPTNAHQLAVLSLALIAGAFALDAAGLTVVVADDALTEPKLAGGIVLLVAGVVFLSQLVPLLVARKARHAPVAP
jgi:hypothetical protein